MNKITYDLNSYQIKNLDFKQALNKGQVDSINMKLLFELDDEVKFDLSWQVWVTFERPDGSTSTNMLATLDGKYYELTIGSWFTDIVGIGSIQVRIKQEALKFMRSQMLRYLLMMVLMLSALLSMKRNITPY